MKKTLVLGASPNPSRYAYIAAQELANNGIGIVLIGIRKGEIKGNEIIIGKPILSDIHTVTIYLNAQIQSVYYDYIINLNPKRIIFNPGAENFEFMQLAKKAGIEIQLDCTLVMLSIGNY
jgi:predicted CoA-binding protein